VDLQLDGKVTPVTGASKGIGRHVAEHPAAEGANVAITARTAAPPEATAKEIRAPRPSFVNGAHIPVDRAQRKAIMDR
jgi:short-subunit dehydrogenase